MNGHRDGARPLLLLLGLLLLAAGATRWYNARLSRHYDPGAAVDDRSGTSAVRAVTIDLNRDGSEWIEQLPGIGPVLARRIVGERIDGGPYADMDDLLARVDGLGPRTALALDGRVVFGR